MALSQNDTQLIVSFETRVTCGVFDIAIEPADADPKVAATRVFVADWFAVPDAPGSPVWNCT
ncbi:hypothetical protein A5700_12165 [Mycobacterium sp. E1214]|nr:hypothetical protein A5700_12165 [Mycobacterium sp. E1214]OBH28690.1 hypothetical protein A5693_21480 [Mycobacterium sp. E1319]